MAKTTGIYRRGAVWWIRYRVDGEEIRESSGSERQADARELLDIRKTDARQGRKTGAELNRVTFEDLEQRLLGHYLANAPRSIGAIDGAFIHLSRAVKNRKPVQITPVAEGKYRATRQRQGLSKRKLADLLGVDPATLTAWEEGVREPRRTPRAVIERFIREAARRTRS